MFVYIFGKHDSCFFTMWIHFCKLDMDNMPKKLKREITRQNISKIKRKDVKWSFVLGQTTEEIQKDIDIEMKTFQDILQMNIKDSYVNISYKTLGT